MTAAHGEDLRADVVVAGAGMAGLTAALAAAEAGARVIVLEKGEEPGGSARISGGLLWTQPTADLMRAHNPHGDPELGSVLAQRFEEGVEWLAGHGVAMSERLTGLFGTGEGHRLQPDMASVVDLLAAAAGRADAEIVCGVAATELLRDARGRVAGLRARGAGGTHAVRAPAVVLCTGGFQGNVELLTRYVSPYADLLHVRSSPRSTGDGLELGLRAGAACSRGLHAFYGHLLPAPPARITPDRFIPLTQYYSVHGIVVNRNGDRFVDESLGDEVTTQALAREPHATGFVVVDAAGAEQAALPLAAGFPALDRLAEVERAGGRVLRAATPAELGAAIDAAGGNGRRTVLELEDFNRRVESDPGSLRIARAGRRRALDRAPFTAVPVVPGITFTEGGLRIDAQARVLDRDGRLLEGLHAAGADGGGVFYEHYAGGLALSLVFGRIAGAGAAVHAAGLREVALP